MPQKHVISLNRQTGQKTILQPWQEKPREKNMRELADQYADRLVPDKKMSATQMATQVRDAFDANGRLKNPDIDPYANICNKEIRYFVSGSERTNWKNPDNSQSYPWDNDQRFKQTMDPIFGIEKGYTNNRHDAGGPTNFGIAHSTYKNLSMDSLSTQQAHEIYYEDYYLHYNLDKVQDNGVRLAMADFLINRMGEEDPARYMQGLLGIKKLDGLFGNETLNKLNSMTPEDRAKFINEIEDRKQELANQSPSFKSGWSKRINEIRKKALEDANKNKFSSSGRSGGGSNGETLVRQGDTVYRVGGPNGDRGSFES